MALAPETLFSDERVRLLDGVSRALGTPRDYESAVRTGARCAVPALANLVVLALGADGLEARLAVAHTDSGQEPRIADLVRSRLPAIVRAATHDAARGRQFRWIPVINHSSTRFLGNEPEILELIAALQVRSVMVVPLRSGGRVLGGMAFVRTDQAPAFTAADLAVAQVIARRAAVAIETAELHERAQDKSRHESRRDRLEDALQKWIQVFDLAGWGAAIVDGTDARIEAVNPAFARIYGYPGPESLTGRLFTDLLPLEQGVRAEEWLDRLPALPDAFEAVHVRADGTNLPVLVAVTALETDRRTMSYVVTVQDLTELKRAEERLHRAQRMEAVGRLAGGVAHEVNNMMTIIIGFGDLLSAAKNLPPDRHRDVDEIRRAAVRAASITQQLLAFSRQQLLQPSDLQLNAVVAKMASVLGLLLPANVPVETDISAEPLFVHADRAQLEQVLINLAFNARDAMPGGGLIRIATGARHLEADDGHRLIGIPIPSGRYVCLSVSDTGHGMDPATLSHVFEPFFTTKPVGTGTGLGLAMVYGIVKQSNGFVWVESTRTSGTTVTICLPQLEQPAREATSGDSADVHSPLQRNVTVLIVEDEEGVRELARRILEDEGCRVIDVKGGVEAVAALNEFGAETDLVLADVIIPDMATTELEQQILDGRPHLPLIYMSGYSRDEVVERGLVARDRPFIQKPFTPGELVAAIRKELAAVSEPVVGH